MTNSIRLTWLLPMLATAAYFTALVIGTHWPRAQFQFGFELGDKFVHLAAYAGQAALCRLTWKTWPPLAASKRITIPLFVLTLCAVGALDELTQIPVPGRSGSVYDWIADALGVAAGLVFFRAIWPLIKHYFEATERPAKSSRLATN